jgi:hypothetical protein
VQSESRLRSGVVAKRTGKLTAKSGFMNYQIHSKNGEVITRSQSNQSQTFEQRGVKNQLKSYDSTRQKVV